MVVGSRRIQQDLSRLLKRPEDRFIRLPYPGVPAELSRAVVGRVDHRADIVENLRHLRIILSDGSGIHAASDDRAEHIRQRRKVPGTRDFHINNWYTPGSYPSWNAPGSLLRRRRPDLPTPRSGISDSRAGPHQSRDLLPLFRLPEDNPRPPGGTDPPSTFPGGPGTGCPSGSFRLHSGFFSAR